MTLDRYVPSQGRPAHTLGRKHYWQGANVRPHQASRGHHTPLQRNSLKRSPEKRVSGYTISFSELRLGCRTCRLCQQDTARPQLLLPRPVPHGCCRQGSWTLSRYWTRQDQEHFLPAAPAKSSARAQTQTRTNS